MKKRTNFSHQRRSARTRGPSGDDGTFLIDSLASIKEFLRFRPSAIKVIYLQEKSRRQIEAQLLAVNSVAASLIQTSGEFQNAAVAKVELTPLDLDDFLAQETVSGKRNLLVALDHVEDPRNVGAIARSAAFFGVRALMVPQDRQAGYTNASVSTSMGGFALVDLLMVVNLAQALRVLKKHGYWIVSADMDGAPWQDVVALHDKVVLVMGSEEKGISRLVREQSDHIVSIAGAEPRVESLNVSVAASLLIEKFAKI